MVDSPELKLYEERVDRYNKAVERGEAPTLLCPKCNCPMINVSEFLLCGDECTNPQCNWAFIDAGGGL